MTNPGPTTTKLILVILRGAERNTLINHLLDAEFHVTEFASMGGFFRRRSTTLLIGARPARVEEALQIIRDSCPTPPDSDEHCATFFVLEAPHFLFI